jgi:hypothetical protein
VRGRAPCTEAGGAISRLADYDPDAARPLLEACNGIGASDHFGILVDQDIGRDP